MKKLLAISAVSFAAVTASAGMKVAVRSDLVSTPGYKDTFNVTSGSQMALMPNFAQIDFDAKIGSASVMGGFNLRKFVNAQLLTSYTGATTNSGEIKRFMAPDAFIDTLYISKPFESGVTVAVGKIRNKLGGYEMRHSKVGDSYLNSLANGGVGGLPSKLVNNLQLAAGATSATYDDAIITTPDNGSGIEVGYGMGDHKFALQILNQVGAADASYSISSGAGTVTYGTLSRLMYGLSYDGSFGDYKATAAYYMGNADTSAMATTTDSITDTKYDMTFTNVGLGAKFAMVDAELDYIMNTKKSDATGAKMDSTASTALNVRFDLGGLNPLLKYEMSEHKASENADSAQSFKRTGIAAGIEYTPAKDEAFRYHAMYVSAADKYGALGTSRNDSVTWSQVIVGVKYTGDLLK